MIPSHSVLLWIAEYLFIESIHHSCAVMESNHEVEFECTRTAMLKEYRPRPDEHQQSEQTKCPQGNALQYHA